MTSFATIDHALGHHAWRYFGEGHKAADYQFLPDTIDMQSTSGRGSVSYDGPWASKTNSVVFCHLSTIDAIILSMLALERVLMLSPIPVEILAATDLVVKAGSAAIEDLSSIEISARADWMTDEQSYRCLVSVANMRLEIWLRPFIGAVDMRPNVAGPSFYSRHLQDRTQHISDIDVVSCSDVSGQISAVFGSLYSPLDDAIQYSGMQSAHTKWLSIPELIVCLAQLAEVTAYEHDQIERDESDNFWLRKVSVCIAEQPLDVGQLISVDGEIVRTNKIRLEDRLWRSLRLKAEGAGFTAIADVAHRLPESALS